MVPNSMRTANIKNAAHAAVVLLGASLLLSALAAPPRHAALSSAASLAGNPSSLSLAIDPAQSKVHWTLPSSLHTVHGTFAMTRGTLSFDRDSGKASGEILVNAKSGQSGNDSRDAKMHKEILETARYPDVVFRLAQVEGNVPNGGSSDVQVRGTLSVHGADHEITALVHAELSGETWRGTAKFDVPYVEWGIKNPSNFFLKASKVVSIEAELAGSLQAR
jgi:polyisoprenoid-binding protein YceI